ncbi:MAG TPA: SpoIIE family protein phosphatase [Candidatus Elarobacter sp.]|nr:SpoIIE family protein phosphatase [Candidatus Elarobacter sp.]
MRARFTGFGGGVLRAGGDGGAVTPFDARAIENIATAPAEDSDRRWGFVSFVVLSVLFILSIPFAHFRLGVVPAFVPAIEGAGVVALLLTAVLLYVQYRIERDLKLALLAIAYGIAAWLTLLYLLAYPGVFGGDGLIGGPQAFAYIALAANVAFGGFLLAEGLAARYGWRASRESVRALAAATVGVTAAAIIIVIAFGARLPVAVAADGAAVLWFRVVAGFVIAGLLLALVVVSYGVRGVIAVWLAVVLLARAFALVSGSELSSGRYSFGWYTARVEELASAVIVLAVFLVKINELMLRLAARSRSTAEALAVGEARYASLANVVPQLIWTTNANGDIEYVNDRWVAYTGYDLNGSRDGGWRAAIHPEQEIVVLDRWRNSVRTGEPFAAEYRLREGATGRYRWFLVNAVPARGKRGEVLAWIGTCTDVDSQKRLEEREAFLARAGERLGASLDVSATVSAIKTLLIPRLAERTWVALLDDEGRYVLTGLGSTEIRDELDTRRAIGSPLPPALHDAVARIVAAGEPVVLDQPDRFPDPWIKDLPAGAAMVVPLASGDVTVGVLALLRANGRAYDVDHVALVREFARRAALSLQHARLYERERTTADALQHAMLPSQLPVLPDIRFSASYSAASESQRVGGDFYDAFTLPDGRVAVTIGDVTGHGLEAAVIMGEIRQALRAASFESADPSAILDRASRLLIASGRTVFVTAVFGVLDPITGRFAYATAGHPPPIVAANGTLHPLPSAGLPIGLRDDEGVDFALRLKAPCTLVLFTDGLMEFARDIGEGQRRIEDAIRALAVSDVEHLAGALMKEVLGEDEPTDDIAILTMSIDRLAADLTGDEFEWRLACEDGRTAAMVRRQVGTLFATWTGNPDAQFAAELAFGELLANAVRYAPGRVRVLAATDGDAVAQLVVEDAGLGFTPHELAPDPLAERGRGLGLVRAVADGIAIERGDHGGTRIVVSFAMAAAERPATPV